MEIKIKADPLPVQDGNFKYSNIKSRYGVNTLYFTKDGKPFLPAAGELHFSRLPHESWRRELLKMKDCGLNMVSTYVFWNFHEEEKGKFDFSGDNDIAKFLGICRDIDMPCILRIGPWDHGEVVRGGFPKRINRLPGKRKNNEKYLSEVEEFWRGLYREVAPYLDGETVIGIQLENEYTGSTEHIRTLRRLAERIGFKTPFFTMTAWPSNVPDIEFLPMVGGYPDGPWNMGKKALKPNNRFSIMPGRTEADIGDDLIKNKTKAKEDAYQFVPYACCETGPGNQVTQHRRPYISEKDGYGVGFAKFASGCNWLGYYMFHGGRNPIGRFMQESRITGYPNNYPVIDYDFQAPLNRYGECRPHGDLLRLMHMFAQYFDPEICTKQAFFPRWRSADPTDISFLKCSVRMNAQMSGYFFSSTYEKGLAYKDFTNVRVTVDQNGKELSLPPINVKAGSMFFYPFNMEIDGVHFDYILAQPIAKLAQNGETVCWFVQCEGIEPKYSSGGKVKEIPVDEEGVTEGSVRIIVLPIEKAKTLHIVNGQAVFADGTVYCDNGTMICEKKENFDDSGRIKLSRCGKVSLPHSYYIYSHGKKQYYTLEIDPALLEECFDIELQFDFSALNLQVFSGKTLINDWFNINGNFVMRLREYKDYIKRGKLMIRTAERTKFGVGNVYQEIMPPKRETHLKLEAVKKIAVYK
ncbi:MAG TPA: beta-galactosidase [Candidatus Eubacterium faecavium]|nr:beta-galactosidase [Candidatus Eubacterium faecavium]